MHARLLLIARRLNAPIKIAKQNNENPLITIFPKKKKTVCKQKSKQTINNSKEEEKTKIR